MEYSAIVRRIAGDALKGLPVVVDVPDARRNDYRLSVLPLFEFRAHFPRVTGSKEFALVVGERRLSCRTNERQPTDLWWSAAGDAGSTVKPAGRRETTGTWIVIAVILEASDPDIPQRVGGQRVRQMAEGHGRHVSVHALSCGERRHECRGITFDPEFFIKTLNQLQVRLELPGELPEDLILFVHSREFRVCARLAVVVAQVLKSREEPNAIAMYWTADIRREVMVLVAFISRRRLTIKPANQDRLAGQA